MGGGEGIKMNTQNLKSYMLFFSIFYSLSLSRRRTDSKLANRYFFVFFLSFLCSAVVINGRDVAYHKEWNIVKLKTIDCFQITALISSRSFLSGNTWTFLFSPVWSYTIIQPISLFPCYKRIWKDIDIIFPDLVSIIL